MRPFFSFSFVYLQSDVAESVILFVYRRSLADELFSTFSVMVVDRALGEDRIEQVVPYV